MYSPTKIKVISAILLSVPLLLAMFSNIFTIRALEFLHNPLLQLIFASPVQFILGMPLYASAFRSLKNRQVGMDLLVVIGTTAAWILSVFNGFFLQTRPLAADSPPVELYFEASAIIICLVLLGRYWEDKAYNRTKSEIQKLLHMQAQTATVMRDSTWKEIPIDEIQISDTIMLKVGDRAPVDSTVLSGTSWVDESMLTGESKLIEKTQGSSILSASINSTTPLVLKAEKLARDSFLSRIVAMVQRAADSKAPIQRLADKVSAYFVPVVVSVATLCFFLWSFVDVNIALRSALAVLVIACPCALGLATPTAISVGTGLAAFNGILIKNADILQKSAQVNTLIFDKTGTITEGRPKIQHIFAVDNAEASEALRIAASIETFSEHPLAKAFVHSANEEGISVYEDLQQPVSSAGKGMSAIVEGTQYYIGKQSFVASALKSTEESIARENILSKEAAQTIERALIGGASLVYLSNSSEVIAVFSVADSIKRGAREAVRSLTKDKFAVWILSGDNKKTVETISEQVGIIHYSGELDPAEKAARVQELQKSEQVVAMVGDGINDAPALAQADISLAMGSGSDLAIETADITLIHNEIHDVHNALVLSKITLRTIKQNLFWAFFYNSIGIPLAALGILNPIFAGFAMASSSICVIINSLCIKYKYSRALS